MGRIGSCSDSPVQIVTIVDEMYNSMLSIYSEESLLQEDNSDMSSLSFSFNNSLHLGSRTDATTTVSGHARFGPVQGQPHTSSNYISLNQRYV